MNSNVNPHALQSPMSPSLTEGSVTHQALVPGTPALIEELVRRLTLAERFDNPKLHRLASDILGGTRAQGTFTPRDLYDALETAVNIYLLSSGIAREAMLSGNPREALISYLRPLTERLPRQTDRTHEQIEWQQFSTPPAIAFVAARALAPTSGDLAMEPSAGTASLAVWLRAAGCAVLTNEIAPRRRALLELIGFAPTAYDGEYLHDLLPREVRPTAFLTNPPFSATGGRTLRHRSIYGANHLASDLRRLQPGGRLVAIASSFMGLERPAFSAWWRQIIERYHVRANLGLPGHEYAKYGTTFDTQLIVINKTGPTPGATLRDQLRQICWGTCATLEEALERLGPIAADRPTPNLHLHATAVAHEVETESIIILTDPHEEGLETDHEGNDHDAPTSEKPTDRLDALEFIPSVETPVGGTASEASTTPAEDEGQATSATRLPMTPERAPAAIYVPYVTRKLCGGREHPARIVEAATMACVDPPEICYRPHLQPEIISEGRLSRLQLERLLYAGQRHEQRLAGGARAGFFLGDGTGTGKGRVLAGIILDNWNQGRRRAVWLSVGQDLIEATRRDLHDLGVTIPLARLNEYPAAGEITLTEGVIFCTYSTLISKAKGGGTRLEQLRRWLHPDSVVIFDEVHKAKNALQTGRGAPTLTGQAVIDLQDPNVSPDYRVVYSSATGATDVRHLAYATRLGLWGAGAPFATFEEFMTEIEAGGMGAMELVARDMKALGMYLSASLSFAGVEYREAKHRLTEKQREMYNAAASAWQLVLQRFHRALDCTGAGNRQRARAMQGFWARHQRFFRLLIASFKVPTLIRETERALSENHAVVISLIGTGEARTKEQVAEALAQGGVIEDLDFSPLEIIVEAVNSCFPTILYEDTTDEATGKTIQVPVERDGQIVQSQEALDLKQQTLDHLQVLALPENPLDQLVNYFGVSQVAEITGRKRRLVRHEQTGALEYRKRAPAGVAMSRTNLYEMAQFQDGQKRIAIISKAASTGISLHASNRAGNRRRREMLTLELSWSADEQMQIFGRVHRTDQAAPPIYVLIASELGGEVRFSSTIARRLGSLGALTKGDRGAVDNELAKYNFETLYGRAALQLLFRRITGASVTDAGEIEMVQIPGLDDPRQTLRDMGLLTRGADGIELVREEDRDHVPRFLNRVLALDVERQNRLFHYFTQLFDEIVAHAKATGTFDEGVQDIRAAAVRLSEPPRMVHTDRTTGATTSHFTLEIDVPTQIVAYEELLAQLQGREYAFYEHRETGKFIACTPSSRHTDPDGNTHRFFAVTKPNGWRVDYLSEQFLLDKYRLCAPEKARDWWQMMVALLPEIETYTQHIISGAIIPLWERIQAKDGDPLKVVRVTTDAGERIVGIAIHASRITRVLGLLGIHHHFTETPEIFRGVLNEGARIELVGEMALKRSRVAGEDRIELVGAHPFRFRELRRLGLISETIKHRQRFFIPTTESVGVEMLSRLCERYPPVKPGEDPLPPETALDQTSGTFTLATGNQIFNLDALIEHPEEMVPGSHVISPAHVSLLPTRDESVPVEPIAVTASSGTMEEAAPDGGLMPATKTTFVTTTHHHPLALAPEQISHQKAHRLRKTRVPANQLGFDFLGPGETLADPLP